MYLASRACYSPTNEERKTLSISETLTSIDIGVKDDFSKGARMTLVLLGWITLHFKMYNLGLDPTWPINEPLSFIPSSLHLQLQIQMF